jgi:hypothetical protein
MHIAAEVKQRASEIAGELSEIRHGSLRPKQRERMRQGRCHKLGVTL